MAKANELKRGKVISHEGALYSVTDVTRVSKGNWRSYLQIKLKSLQDGRIVDQRFSPDDRVEVQFVDTKPFQFLYRDGNNFVVPLDIMSGAEQFLRGEEIVSLSFIDGRIVSVELPTVVELKVVETPPVVKGATATNQNKDATLETGLRCKVPPFVDVGEDVRIDTRSGEYLERAR
jgi:elongation factor P